MVTFGPWKHPPPWPNPSYVPEGGNGVPPPLGCAPPPRVFRPRGPKARKGQNSGGSNRDLHRSHEICVETHKKARQGSLRALWPARKTGSLWLSGAPGHQHHQQLPFWISGPLWLWGPSKLAGVLWISPSDHQGPSNYQGSSQLSGALW